MLNLEEPGSWPCWPCFSADGEKLAIARLEDGGPIEIRDSLTGKLIATAPRHERLNRMAIRPDGGAILTASSDSTARVWFLDSERTIWLRGHTDEVRDVDWLRDGPVTVGMGGLVRMWKLRRRPDERRVITPGGSSVCFDPDGRRIAFVRGRLHVHDVARGNPLLTVPGDMGYGGTVALGHRIAVLGSMES